LRTNADCVVAGSRGKEVRAASRRGARATTRALRSRLGRDVDSRPMPAEYVFPVGLHVDAPETSALAEGYEVRWRDGDDPPHYFFYAQLSVLRVQHVLDEALALMPPRCRAVLELRRTDERA